MINLVRNELSKIFHKKGIYIYGAIIVILLAVICLADKLEPDLGGWTYDYYGELERRLEDYDLNDEYELSLYIEEKSEVDVHKLTKDYDYSSPEYYYIEDSISPLISSMNNYKYKVKNDELYNEVKNEYDALVARLDDFDWKISINEKIDMANEEIEVLKLRGLEYENEKYAIETRINNIQTELYCLNYRLEHEVPFAYNEASFMIDNYTNLSEQYLRITKVEDSVRTREQVVEDNEVITQYNLVKYQMDNGLLSGKEDSVKESYIMEIQSAKVYVFIAFLIIAGGIFAEEFNKGTIKQLLVKPYTRTQIFISKLIAVAISTVIFTLFIWVVFLLYEIFSYGGIKDLFEPVIVYDLGKEAIVKYNVFTYLFIDMLASLPRYIILAGVCILMGVWFTSTVSAVVSSLGLHIFGELVVLLPDKFQSFIPFRCWEFTEFLFGNVSSNQYVSLPLSITVCVITVAILYVLALVIFNKKDIKNQ